MISAYIYHCARHSEPDEIAIKLRDALKAVAQDRPFEILDAFQRTTLPIAGSMDYESPGKAIAIQESEAESLARSLGEVLGKRAALVPHSHRFNIGGNDLVRQQSGASPTLYAFY